MSSESAEDSALTSIDVRVALALDLPSIVEIYNAAIPGRRATADLDAVSVQDRRPWFEKHHARRPLWVAGDALRTLGWLSLEDFYGRPAYRRTAEVSVYVAPSAQRRGVGSALLRRAIDESPRIGLAVLVGFIFGHNVPSLDLFERHGFVRSGTLHDVAELDGRLSDLVIVTREISGR